MVDMLAFVLVLGRAHAPGLDSVRALDLFHGLVEALYLTLTASRRLEQSCAFSRQHCRQTAPNK